MRRKIAIYSFIFILLLVSNFFLARKLYFLYNKDLSTKNFLSKIAKNDTKRQFNFSFAPFHTNFYTVEAITSDNRVANLKAFFRKYNSPLYNHAQKIVSVSDKYGFDYRLLPAIAMQESNLCRHTPTDSYNCWGWGIYGDKVLRFKSYDDAIEKVGKGIKKHYIDKGLVTASAIMKKYTPPSTGSWAYGVNTFLRALE